MIRKLLSNVGTHKLVPDDWIRLFLDWIDHYHEVHFGVIKAIYKSPGATWLDVWRSVDGKEHKENSMEADLFKFLIRELSTGGGDTSAPRGGFLWKFL